MFTFRRPSSEAVAAYLERQGGLPLSYESAEMTRGPAPEGFVTDRLRRRLGTGSLVFQRASNAIRRWYAHQQGWAHAEPTDAPPRAGACVAIAARIGAGWFTNGCRIVYVTDEVGPPSRFGFAYGTLIDHVECGEARFVVERDADDVVWYEVLTHSRPRLWLARLGRPVTRWYQRRFARGAADAVARAVQDPAFDSA
jgi:uncharacterized protein (UPF0548 family)